MLSYHSHHKVSFAIGKIIILTSHDCILKGPYKLNNAKPCVAAYVLSNDVYCVVKFVAK